MDFGGEIWEGETYNLKNEKKNPIGGPRAAVITEYAFKKIRN